MICLDFLYFYIITLIIESNSKSSADERKERPNKRDKFTYNALQDSLPGLYNHSAFDILFHDSDHDHIAVLLADIDKYTEIKREKGKEYAERIVCGVADTLRRNFRSVDHLCRLRDDEFVVIMTRVTSSGKDLVFSKIESINKAPKETDDGCDPITLIIGVAFSDREKPTADVFQDADTALNRMREMRQSGYAVY